MTPTYDALIVGARPAGAATAMLLARAGARVLVVERDAPGTDTPSTHALMRGAVMQLTRWGLVERLRAAGTPPVRRTTFAYAGSEIVIDLKPQHGVDALLSPRRTVLDPMLAAAAVEAGATLCYHTRLLDVQRGADGRVCGAVLSGPDGAFPVSARLVVGADGRVSRLARAVGAPARHHGRHAAATLYAYVAGIEDRGNRWHYAPGAAAGAIPTNAGLHVVFVAIPPARFRTAIRGDLAGALHRILAEVAPGLAAEARAGTTVTRPVAFAGSPGHLRAAHGPGWALVGDAGYYKDPITAHGLTDALRDAELLAGAVLAGQAAAFADYEATRDALSLPLFRATDAIAGFDWTLDALETLHRELHQAMRAEQDWLAGARVPAAA
jgi:2-polyprenyl-6-methoxyphenol hydroxylase-like FAD-dependent oxidoreductase